MYSMFLLIIIGIVLCPIEAFALVPHKYPGVYTNTVARIFYFLACMVVAFYLYRNNLHKIHGWRYFYLSIFCFTLWNLDMLIARSSEIFIFGQSEGLNYFKQYAILGNFWEVIVYIAHFDHIIMNTATLLFYIALKQHLMKTKQETVISYAPLILPYSPVIIYDFIGASLQIILTFLCLKTSIQLYKSDRDNIIWNYMVWLSGSYFFYALSRSFGYIFKHIFIISGAEYILKYIEPISGSINTLTFIWLGTLSLFFIRMWPIYTRMSEDKKKIENINTDIITLNKDLQNLVAERTMAILGLSVADKVRNPVAIIGCVCKRLVNKEKLSERVSESLMDVLEECKKLERIVNDFENILRSRHRLFTYIDLNEIVKEITMFIKDDAKSMGITIIEDLSEKPVKINAQKNLLKAGIFHIIKNAMDACQQNGVITIKTMTEGDKVILSIEDNGLGIPEENLDKIFDPFFSTHEKRMGMGLPLVKQIVAEHLGEIRVNSKVNRGTKFEIIFPVKWCVIAEDVRREVSNGVKT
ncbi:MAG: ATP-binding protein [Thermodesulfovibrionales bacterium]|nr:ATP-binding protein [Thermodesulfovibrionales bacterium]